MTASGEAGCSVPVLDRWATALGSAALSVLALLVLVLVLVLMLSLELLRLDTWA